MGDENSNVCIKKDKKKKSKKKNKEKHEAERVEQDAGGRETEQEQ